MSLSSFSNSVRAKAALLVLVVAGSLVAPRQSEAALAAFAHDPTPTKVYFQFSTIAPYDAYQAWVVTPAGAVVATTGLIDPLIMKTGASNNIGGLTPGAAYRLIIKVRYAPGTGMVKEADVAFIAA